MSRNFLALNLALVALLVWIGWTALNTWQEMRVEQAIVLAQSPYPKRQFLPPAPEVESASPADYTDVFRRTLFSPDRDPNVHIEVPPTEIQPAPVMPSLPVYHGQIHFGEPVILLSVDSAGQRPFRLRETAGEFTIVSFDRDAITLEWNGKTLKRELDEMTNTTETASRTSYTPGTIGYGSKVHDAQRQSFRISQDAPHAAAVSLNRSLPAWPERPNVRPVGVGDSMASAAEGNAEVAREESRSGPTLGRQTGSLRTCVAGDASPSGTVLDGYQKVSSTSLMGTDCHWEPIQSRIP